MMTYTHTILVAALAASSAVTSARIQLPESSATLEPGAGADLATAYCSVCHSLDYITMQPPGMPRSFWAGSVTKMKVTFGAPIPDEAEKALVDYLTAAYGTP